MKLLIFGGTTEGRELAQWCAANGIPADVSVTTGYGARLLGQGELLNVFTGKLDCKEMQTLMTAGNYAAVVDATHPYAAEATANIKRACAETGTPCLRLAREECVVKGMSVSSDDALVELLNGTDKVILSTLGSKELPLLARVHDRRRRVWLRVLPAEGIKEQCAAYGFDPSHVIAQTPPYTVEENKRHIRRSGAQILVTKESGAAGGYPEKTAAAEELGIETITLTRPREKEVVYSFDELTGMIGKMI